MNADRREILLRKQLIQRNAAVDSFDEDDNLHCCIIRSNDGYNAIIDIPVADEPG